jgi:hypothetical protein
MLKASPVMVESQVSNAVVNLFDLEETNHMIEILCGPLTKTAGGASLPVLKLPPIHHFQEVPTRRLPKHTRPFWLTTLSGTRALASTQLLVR